MKKILLAAVAALAIVGCSQNEEIEKAGEKAEINFTTIVGKTTRVTPMVANDFKSFKVFAYNTTTNDMGSEAALTTKFMDDITANKSEEGVWGIDKGPYYWPMKDQIQFFAYSPVTNVKDYAATTGYPSFAYTIQPVATQEDLLVAKVENATKTKNGKNGVNLVFAHILTQINFSAKLEDGATYTVTKIEISGIKNTGTFVYGAGDATGDWTSSGSTSYEYVGKYDATIDANVADFSTGDNALMLLPQTLATDAKIAITYSVVKGTTTTFSGTKEVSLNGQEWEIGKNLRYTLELSSDATEVTIKPTVNEWGAEDPATPNKPE